MENTSICPLENKLKKKSQGKTPIVTPTSHCLISGRLNVCPDFSLFCEVLEGQTICIADAVGI